MVDLKPITEAILADAEGRAEGIKEETYAILNDIKAKAKTEMEHIKEDFENRLADEIDQLYSAENALIRDRQRTALLKAKDRAVKIAAEAAEMRICQLDNREYHEFICGLLKRVEIEKDSVVFLNERDKGRLDEKIFAPASVSDKCIDAMGGFKVSGKDADYDMTIEALLEEKFEEISCRIGRIFEKGEP